MSGPLRVVTFDAGGTLFEVREPVGATYGRLARREGFDATDDALERAFRRAFAHAPPMAPPASVERTRREAWGRAWWREIVRRTLADAASEATVARDVEGFERFFDATFAHYARAEAWRVFDDARPALDAARARGLRVGVVSNFDGRLHRLLAGLGLAGALDGAFASVEVGAAKPDPEIFRQAGAALGGPGLHVGDSLALDAAGARAAGWRCVWLARDDGGPAPAGVPRIGSLAELGAALDETAAATPAGR